MEAANDALHPAVGRLVAQRLLGHGLPGAFYRDADVYQADIERIWRRGWLFAGHACEIPRPGDYFTFDVDVDSLIVLRGDDGEIRAHHNVCRHRGMRLCAIAAGHLGRIVCPYHQWTYARDGELVACRGMPPEFDKTTYSLRTAATRTVEGLIFVSLSPEPPPFEPAAELIGPLARPQGLTRAKLAKAIDYEVAANWKIVWENNRECYHCNANHPQYIKANFDHYNADDTTERVARQIEAVVERSEAKWTAAGLAVTHRQTGMTHFPDAEGRVWYSANRTPLVDGYVSESMDGRQIAPLMGDYTDADVGTLRMRTLPNFWNHSSCDHAVSTRLAPAGPQTTRIRVSWLVAAEAVEGRDYHLETLLPFWQLTSEQDWRLCEEVQRGVLSSAYEPGPLSPYKEYDVDALVNWYLKRLTSPA